VTGWIQNRANELLEGGNAGVERSENVSVAEEDFAAGYVEDLKAVIDFDVIRASDTYKNFYSSQGVTIVGAPPSSRLFQKPLLLNVLHGGGQIFANQSDDNAKLIAYWINHPMPETQDEFGSAANNLFTPADPKTGTCNTQ